MGRRLKREMLVNLGERRDGKTAHSNCHPNAPASDMEGSFSLLFYCATFNVTIARLQGGLLFDSTSRQFSG